MSTRSVVLAVAVAVAVVGCAKHERPASAPAASPTPAPPAVAAPTPVATPEPGGTRLSASRESEEACVDRWLAERRLDRYGNPDGTLYAGGTPLFDERTGKQVDRLVYVYKRQPLAQATCRPTVIN